jgi:hypothetical protein
MRFRLAALVLAAVALAGCGQLVRMAYDNADYAVRVSAHEYFDLHGEQSDLAKAQIRAFHEWHRREEMPAYAALLASAAQRVERGLAREDVTWMIDNLRARYAVLARQAADDMAPVLATFTPANYSALEKKLAKNNERFAKEWIDIDPAKRERERVKLLVSRFEDWTGDLNDEQKGLLRAYVRAMPDIARIQLADRERRQREFVRLLESARTSPDLGARVSAFFLDWETDRSPEYAKAARAREAQLVQLILDLDRTLTPKQRNHAVRRLQSLAEDCFVLAGVGKRPEGTRAAAPAAAGG